MSEFEYVENIPPKTIKVTSDTPISASINGVVPVSDNSGSLTVDQGTAANLKTEIWGGAKGATVTASPTVTAAGVDRNGLDVVLRDSTGTELDFRQEAENVNASDHGILIFARDYESTPDKYRMIRCSQEGYLEVHTEGTNSQYVEPHTEDFDTGGGTENVTAFGIAVPASGGAGVVPGDETTGLWVNVKNSTSSPVPIQPPLVGYLNVAIDQTGNNNAVDVLTMPTTTVTGTIAATQSGTWTVQPGNTANTTAWLTTPIPNQYELAGVTTHVKKYYTNAGAVTDGIVWSPAAGKRWYVTDIFIQVSAAATVTLEDDLTAGDSPVWKAELAANSGWSHSFTTPLFSGEDAADLLITTSAGNVYVTVTGYEI